MYASESVNKQFEFQTCFEGGKDLEERDRTVHHRTTRLFLSCLFHVYILFYLRFYKKLCLYSNLRIFLSTFLDLNLYFQSLASTKMCGVKFEGRTAENDIYSTGLGRQTELSWPES